MSSAQAITSPAAKREHIYATAGVTWSPMPQYSVVGQVVYEEAEISSGGVALDGDALSFLNYWIYKF